MAPLAIVKFLESKLLLFQVASSPIGYLIEMLGPDCPDEPLRERVRSLVRADRLNK
jgi:hypothetical protein